MLNTSALAQEDDALLNVSDYVTSGKEIEVGDFHIRFKLYEDDNGKLSKMSISWNETGMSDEQFHSTNWYISHMISYLSPENAKDIFDALGFIGFSEEYYYNTVTENGSVFDYDVLKSANKLTITPAA